MGPLTPAAIVAEAVAADRRAFGRLLARLAPWLEPLDVGALERLGRALDELASPAPRTPREAEGRLLEVDVDPREFRRWLLGDHVDDVNRRPGRR